MRPAIREPGFQPPKPPLTGRWASIEEFERELRESNLKFLEEIYNTETEDLWLKMDD